MWERAVEYESAAVSVKGERLVGYGASPFVWGLCDLEISCGLTLILIGPLWRGINRQISEDFANELPEPAPVCVVEKGSFTGKNSIACAPDFVWCAHGVDIPSLLAREQADGAIAVSFCGS